MKFLHLNHRYWPFHGGSERFIQEISEHLVTLGHDVRVLTSNAHDLELFWQAGRRSVTAAPRETLSGVDVERLPVDHGLTSGNLRFGVARRLQGEVSRIDRGAGPQRVISRRLIRLEQLDVRLRASPTPDLIHVTNLGLEGLALEGAMAASRLAIPYVITPFTHIGRDDDAVARRFVSMPHQRKLLREAASVLLMSERERGFMLDIGVSPAKAFVVGAGVHLDELRNGDVERFRAKHGIGDEYLIASLGALAPDKGTPQLVEAVQSLRARGRPVRLVLAGPELSAFTSWYAENDRADGGIHRLGVIDESEKRDVLAAMDVLALPSRTESFGIVYLEAWAVEKPVIAARAGGVVDVVSDGEDGLMVAFGSTHDICLAIERLMDNAGMAAQFGKRGRQKVERHYQWEQVLKRVERAYDHALGPASVR